MITQTVIPDDTAKMRAVAEHVGLGGLQQPRQVPLEEEIGRLRQEIRELAAKIDRIEKHQHGASGEVLIPVNSGAPFYY